MSVPDAPIISIRPKCGNQTIEIFWQAPAMDGGSPITLYGIAVYDSGGGGVFFHSVDSTIRRYTIINLTNGIKYVVKVRAINAIGSSAEAIYRTVEPGLRPSVPQNAAAESAGNTAALVTWDAPTGDGGADIGWYVVQSSSTNPADPVIKFSAHGYDRQRYVTGLSGVSEYTFKVYAVNDPGYSPAATTNPIDYDTLVSFTASTYSGSGPWADDSGNGRNATIETGTAAKNTAGNGIVLDGSTGWRFDPIGSHNAWTILTWFKRTGPSDAGASILTERFSTNTYINMAIISGAYGPSATQFAGGFFNGSSWNNGTPITFPLNEWHPMVVTWDGTNIRTYFDGSLNSTVNYVGSSSLTQNQFYRIGARWDGSAYLNGELGELILHSRAVSGAEVTNYVAETYETYALVETATLSDLSGASTNLSSSWAIGYPHAVTVRYYSTNSSTVPPSGGTLVGTAQSVSAGTTTNTLDPAVTPVAGTYYFVGVTSTATGSTEVRSATALLMPAAVAAGSIAFTYITGQGDGGLGPDTQYQYLTMSPGLSFANDDFTIQFWIKPGPRGSFDDDHSEGAGVLGRANANALSVFFYHWDGLTVRTGASVATLAGFPSALTEGTWYYIAVQRYTDPADSQGYISVWLDGTQIADNNFGSDNESACSSATTYLGFSPEDRKYISSGNLANVRVIIGTALYDHTANISVPTQPFTNITNTELLLVMPSSIPSTDESSTQTLTNSSAGGQAIATWSSANPF